MSGVRRLVYGLIGKKADFPPFDEYVRGIRANTLTMRKADNRTAMEIVTDLVKKLEGEA